MASSLPNMSAEELTMQLERRRRRMADVIATLRSVVKLRPDCCRVEDAAEDAAERIRELEAERDVYRLRWESAMDAASKDDADPEFAARNLAFLQMLRDEYPLAGEG